MCDPLPYLEVKKNRKFMGIQDDLAVVTAGLALASAGLGAARPGEAAGLYLAVGYIPFEQEEIEALLAGSVEAGQFSMARFSTTGIRAVKPLITFRCLPNMPAFHISSNFDVQGPYFVTYPGPGQFYLALEAACTALRRAEIEYALVGGVADQQNFLVRHHFSRLDSTSKAPPLADAAGCLVLETEPHALRRDARVRARLETLELSYEPADPREVARRTREEFTGCAAEPWDLGPASLPATLDRAASESREGPLRLRHELQAADGMRGESEWVLP
ncbi:MAG: hypothetical protein HY303_21150 [Candidatus Wallbacteria bacterium]|nr:hypothetical protein [Candidatus Wallbacteria bacterium]